MVLQQLVNLLVLTGLEAWDGPSSSKSWSNLGQFRTTYEVQLLPDRVS